MIHKAVAAMLLCPIVCILADDTELKHREPLPPNGIAEYRIDQGKKIAVRLLTTVYIRSGVHSDKVDLKTVFPVIVDGHTVIPAGSFLDAEVAGFHHSASKDRAEIDLRLKHLMISGEARKSLHSALATIIATAERRGSEVYIAPDTTTEMILQDPIAFPIEREQNR